MSYKSTILLILLFLNIYLVSCGDELTEPDPEVMQLVSLRIGTSNLLSDPNKPQPNDKNILLTFSHALDTTQMPALIVLRKGSDRVQTQYSYLDEQKTVALSFDPLDIDTEYSLSISDALTGTKKETFSGYNVSFTTINTPLGIVSVAIDGTDTKASNRILNVSRTPVIQLAFTTPVAVEELENNLSINGGDESVSISIGALTNDTLFDVSVQSTLNGYERYELFISQNLKSKAGNSFATYRQPFYTELDSTLKFPEISDEELLTKVQEQTFKYFWDFGHPVSGLTRERNTSGETVTSGGSGFGLMAILVGIERGFITRQEGIDRLETIIDFLDVNADKFHGAWSHWLNGTTGDVVPFSSNDNGGDLVETAFMAQGLLTVRQYLNADNTQEAAMIETINKLWEGIEWDWYTQNGQDVLYWHWSPNFEWEKNHAIQGWNEALIVYVLAAASPTHSIDQNVYTKGWSRDGAMVNSNNSSYYGYQMDLRSDRGGPLFFAHYSFLGLDPRNLTDQYANYWDQNVNHTLINRAYCISNPKDFVGYASYSWGLTASDNHEGYNAHSPDNDLGVITPTAAISSLPYTPEESMAAIRHFYYILGDRLWGEYGFYDAFNITEGWTASSYLAIDQGPIVVMIENHRTGLLWDLFMSAPEVQSGLDKLGFTYE
ncbi:glucoamylase family protein [Marinoscillum sp.]|uniref:glucoamylase family protein n=1 Tax=Marinoscillum sp. TaxID=2024838 RepID=UPI003BA9B802